MGMSKTVSHHNSLQSSQVAIADTRSVVVGEYRHKKQQASMISVPRAAAGRRQFWPA
jgi:hypothetical protein